MPLAKPPWPTSSWRGSSWNATSPSWRAPTTRWWWWARMSSSSNWWTQPGSFQVVKTLHNKLYESWGKTRMPVVLVGNKADLSLQSREVKTDEGKKLAESWGAIFLESSAKESQVWGRVVYPTRGWEQGPRGAGADVPSFPGDPGDLHEDHRGD
ncbi:GTPase RhebL1 isoform 7-T7 [Morphnus guianensis]